MATSRRRSQQHKTKRIETHQAKYMNVSKVSMCERTCVYAHAVRRARARDRISQYYKNYLIYVACASLFFSSPV